MSSTLFSERLMPRLRYEVMHLWMAFYGLKFLNIGIAQSGASIALVEAQTAVYERVFERLQMGGEWQQSPSLLEIGAGISPGHQLAKLHNNWSYESLDASWAAVLRGKWNGVQCQQGSISHLPHESQTLDAVCAVECICVVKPDERAAFFSELKRVLVPGGRLVSVDFYPVKSDQAQQRVTQQCESLGLQLDFVEDLTTLAQIAIEQTEPERATLFDRIPGFVRNSEFGRGLRETLSLEGSEHYRRWLAGERSYLMYGWSLK